MRNPVSRRIARSVIVVIGLVAVGITSVVSVVGSEFLLRAGLGVVPLTLAVLVTAGLGVYLARRGEDQLPSSSPEQSKERKPGRPSGLRAAHPSKGLTIWRTVATVVLSLVLVALILAGVTILFPMR